LATTAGQPKRNPGKLSYGTPNVASNFHLAGELIKQMAGIDMVHVPYKGGAPTQQALVAGEVPVAIFSNTSATAAYKAGKLRVLAVLDGRWLKDWPEVPSIREFLPTLTSPVNGSASTVRRRWRGRSWIACATNSCER
jgi:tripartite-type tricarboxylate transporter receptor subunit TctC